MTEGKILSMASSVLDNIGSVELLDYMASDLDVVNAARVSHLKESLDFEGRDAKLIGFLMRKKHGSPFEHAVFRWRIKAPLFVVGQWQRHRIAAYSSFNQQSGRWTKFDPEFYTPTEEIDIASEEAYIHYRYMLDHDMAKEQARMILPQNLYTTFWFTCNARSLLNFFMLRNAPEAQQEIKLYAEVLEEMFSEVMPATHAAFVENGRIAP